MPPKKKCGGKKCKQVGGWFWEEKDPYFGGVVKTIKNAVSNVKPSKIAELAGNFIPGLNGVADGLKMVGMGHTRGQRGCGLNFNHDREQSQTKDIRDDHGDKGRVRRNHFMLGEGCRTHQRGKGQMLLTPNSTSYGGIKF